MKINNPTAPLSPKGNASRHTYRHIKGHSNMPYKIYASQLFLKIYPSVFIAYLLFKSFMNRCASVGDIHGTESFGNFIKSFVSHDSTRIESSP